MRPPGRRLAHLAATVALTLVAAGCGVDPGADLPAGTLWAGDAAAARELLAGLGQLGDSPVAQAARRLAGELAACRRFVAFCPAGDEACALSERVACDTGGELLAAADAVRGDAAWILSRREGEGHLTAWGTVRPAGGLDVRAFLAVPEKAPQPWQALLPARRAPAAPVLAADGALLLLRLRSDRGTAAFAGLTTGDRAAEMYGLRASALLAVALEGTSEVALYEPAPGEQVPPLALAIHVRLRDAAVEAMEGFLADLRARWPVSRSPWSLAGHDGACLSNLNVLPAFAPCYVATERALVVGWNQRSVELALRAAPDPGAERDSRLSLDLARLPAADQRLRESYRVGAAAAVPAYPWSSLTVAGRKRGGGYELALRLGDPSAPAAAAAAARQEASAGR